MRVELCYNTPDNKPNQVYIIRDIQSMKKATKIFNKLQETKIINYAYLRAFQQYRYNTVKVLKGKKTS